MGCAKNCPKTCHGVKTLSRQHDLSENTQLYEIWVTYAMDSVSEVTQLLIAWSEGDESALERLAPLVQAELKRIALRS